MQSNTKYPLILFVIWLIIIPVAMVAAADTDNTVLAEKIDAYMTTLTENGFSGAVLVARGGEIVHSEGYGLADDSAGIANTADTVFDTASLSKQFTAAAIMHLAEQGKLSVEDTLADYFDDVPDDKADITIHQLMTHTSGLTPYAYEGDLVEINRDDAIQTVLTSTLTLDPGTRYLYSDTGYGTLAIIIELVANQSFQAYLHEHLFEPAGMHSTGFYNDARWSELPVARGYFNEQDGGIVSENPGPYYGILGFGGVLTTVEDLYRWHLALTDHTVLSAESVEMLFTPYTDEDNDGMSYYGYGWVVMEFPSHGTVIWHSGAAREHNAIFLNFVEQDMQVIVLSNRIGGTRDDEIFYAEEAGFILSQAILADNFSIMPGFVS